MPKAKKYNKGEFRGKSRWVVALDQDDRPTRTFQKFKTPREVPRHMCAVPVSPKMLARWIEAERLYDKAQNEMEQIYEKEIKQLEIKAKSQDLEKAQENVSREVSFRESLKQKTPAQS